MHMGEGMLHPNSIRLCSNLLQYPTVAVQVGEGGVRAPGRNFEARYCHTG